MKRRFALAGFVTVLLFLAVGADRATADNTGTPPHNTAKWINICCAWDTSLNDSDGDGVADLTFSISGGGTEDKNTVRAAVRDWETALNNAGFSFELNEVPSRDKSANIKIEFTGRTTIVGCGGCVGLTSKDFDTNGFISSAKIEIALGRNTQGHPYLPEIARGVMGFALGLLRANFDDLMDGTIGLGSVTTISACDVEAVVATQHWKLADGLDAPHKPHVDHVHCA